MALQDVCGFQNSPMRHRFNPPGLLSGAMEHTSPNLDVTDKHNYGQEALKSSQRDGGTPLSFFIPPPPPRNFGHFNRGSSSLFSPASSSSSPVRRPFPLSHGTTTLAFVFQGGVIAAADSRASAGGLVACPAVHKITPVHSHLVVTSSGSGADCMLWERALAREIRLYQLRNRRRLSTAGSAKLLAHMLHPFKGTEVCVAVTLCGWDAEVEDRAAPDSAGTGSGASGGGSGSGSSVATPPLKRTLLDQGPKVVYVCSDGARLQGELISVGSGSPYAYGVLDGGLRWSLSEEEAVALAREAVFRATRRDAYSGNSVDLFHITAQGWSRREREDLREEFYREEERMMKRVKERRDEAEMEEGD